MSFRKQKVFRLDRGLAGDFEKACTILGILEQDAVAQAVRDWLEKNQLQASLETWIREDKRPVVFQNLTLIKLQLSIVKEELKAALQVYKHEDSQYRFTNLTAIRKIFPTALTLANETKDPELTALIKQVEAITQEAAART